MHRPTKIALVSILVSTALVQGAQLVRSPRQLTGETPEKNVVSQVTVGDILYSKFDYIEYYGARLTQPYTSKFMLGRIEISRDLLFVEGSHKGQLQYCSREKLSLGDILCFRDVDEDGDFEGLRVPSLRWGGWTEVPHGPISYKEGVDQELTKGFRQELLYQGVAGSSLSISYREFQDSFARPAFQQELHYTLDPAGETEIGFKGAKIIVLSASNTSLRYRVASGIP